LKKIALIFGTRPEAIKLAPIYFELQRLSHFVPVVIITSQHVEMLKQVLNLFGIIPDYDLKVMKTNQTLSILTASISSGLDEILSKEKVDFSIVQGDTTSAFVGALISFYHNIPVGHVEAGLRSYDMKNPFPEEANRRLISVLSSIHFAPTQNAKANLLRESIAESRIFVTGNTVVDALYWIKKNKQPEMEMFINKIGLKKEKYIYITMHRRENWGEPMRNVLRGIKKVLQIHPEYKIVFPVHLNPIVREVVYNELDGIKNAILIDPVNYIESIALINGCQFVVTDSGGLQEEAPTLSKPCLILRKTTERPEAVEAGVAKLIGTSTDNVIKEMSFLIENEDEYRKMSKALNPFGNGKSAEQIVNILNEFNLDLEL